LHTGNAIAVVKPTTSCRATLFLDCRQST